MELYNIWTVIPAAEKAEKVIQWLTKLTAHFNAHYSRYGKFEVMTSMDGPLRGAAARIDDGPQVT